MLPRRGNRDFFSREEFISLFSLYSRLRDIATTVCVFLSDARVCVCVRNNMRPDSSS